MRRPTSRKFYQWHRYNVLQDIEPRKLQLIGAIILEWNFIEDMIDECLHVVLRLDPNMHREVSSRLNGLDGKFEIIKRAVHQHLILNPPEQEMIAQTIGAVSIYKKHRDSVVHARLESPQADISMSQFNKGRATEFLFSTDALLKLLQGMEALNDEVVSAYYILEMNAWALWEIDVGDIDPNAARASPEFQAARVQHQEHQSHRRSLEPLAQFPQSLPTPEGMGDHQG